MIKIEYPDYSFKVGEEDGKPRIFDGIRKRWVAFTPEEWVRQNFIRYLIENKNYPSSVISIEKEITLNDLKKRYDAVVYKNDVPWMLIECKGMDVQLNAAVLEQVLIYNLKVPVPFIVVTNGIFTYAWNRNKGKLIAIESLPNYY